MQFHTDGDVARLDLDVAIELWAGLRDEWAGLRFDDDGQVVNPRTEQGMAELVLVEGTHRRAGARYRITTEATVFGLPEERQAEFDEERARLEKGRAGVGQWESYAARRKEAATIPVGVQSTTTLLAVERDDAGRFVGTVSDPDQRWAVDVEVVHDRLPRIELSLGASLTKLVKEAGSPGCLSGLFGGTAEARATMDLAVLDRGGGTLVVGWGRANRFRGTLDIDLGRSTTAWPVDARATVTAKGLGRIVLLFGGRRLRRRITDHIDRWWEQREQWAHERADELADLERAVEAEGGPAAFVHRWLWDPDFTPNLPGRPAA